jgi:hypothetical protein
MCGSSPARTANGLVAFVLIFKSLVNNGMQWIRYA